MRRSEFAKFAGEFIELVKVGSVHQSDVVRSYRLYYSKYRTFREDEDEEEGTDNITDAAVVRLLRSWNRTQGMPLGRSSGFYKILKVKTVDQAVDRGFSL